MKSNGTTRKAFKRVHFHKRNSEDVSCYELYTDAQADRMPEFHPKSNNPRGRPRLDLTDEQRHYRLKLLRRLKHQVDYYITSGRINLGETKNLVDINIKEVKQAKRFQKNLRHILGELDTVGGPPTGFAENLTNSNVKIVLDNKESSGIN